MMDVVAKYVCCQEVLAKVWKILPFQLKIKNENC